MDNDQQRSFSVYVIDEDQIDPALDEVIRTLLCVCFPSDAKAFWANRAWNNARPAFSVIGRNGDEVVAQVGIVERQITCGAPLRVAGIQSLAVAPEMRGSGLSQRLMTTAMNEARRRGILAALLFAGGDGRANRGRQRPGGAAAVGEAGRVRPRRR